MINSWIRRASHRDVCVFVVSSLFPTRAVSRALVAGAVATAAQLSHQLTDAVLRTETGARLVAAHSPRSHAAKEVARSSIHAAGLYLRRIYQFVSRRIPHSSLTV